MLIDILNKGREFNSKYEELLKGAEIDGPYGVRDFEYNNWLQEAKIEFALFVNGEPALINQLDDTSSINHYYEVRLGGARIIEPYAARHTAVMNYIIKNLTKGQVAVSQSLLDTIEKENRKITTVLNQTITVTGDGNVLNTGDYSTITAKINVYKGNKEILQKSLIENGVSKEDISELLKIIDTEVPNEKTLTFGSKVNIWLSKMFAKALDGSWEIGIATAGGILAEVIQRYYGMK